jgi:hypothetical protein
LLKYLALAHNNSILSSHQYQPHPSTPQSTTTSHFDIKPPTKINPFKNPTMCLAIPYFINKYNKKQKATKAANDPNNQEPNSRPVEMGEKHEQQQQQQQQSSHPSERQDEGIRS